MKKIASHTIRGAVASSDTAMERLQLFDGSFDTGYRVTFFEVSITDRDNTNVILTSAKLATEDVADNTKWYWSDNREIAWSASVADANGVSHFAPETIIDEDNMIVQDLFIGAVANSSCTVNYLIKLDKYDITDWQGALAMVRNKSQG